MHSAARFPSGRLDFLAFLRIGHRFFRGVLSLEPADEAPLRSNPVVARRLSDSVRYTYHIAGLFAVQCFLYSASAIAWAVELVFRSRMEAIRFGRNFSAEYPPG